MALSPGDNGITAGGVVGGSTQIHLWEDGTVRVAGDGNMTSLIL